MTKDNEQKRGAAIKAAIEKIVVNAGVGRASQAPNFSAGGGSAPGGQDKSVLGQIQRDLALLAGQKSQIRPARKSIAGFKIREGQVVGLKITLRGRKMVDFFERLIRIVLPRVHDFRGIHLDSLDAGGGLNIGFREQFVFPETNPEESPFTFPLGVTIVPKKKDRPAALAAYRALGVPLQKESEAQIAKRKSRKRKTKK